MSEKDKVPYFLFLVIVLIGCATQFAADIYAPSLVSISEDLNTSINNVQYSMSVFMLGVALGQLTFGPISEGIGRKNTIIIGLFIMTLGIIVTLIATDIEMIILGRFIQGLGGGGPAALWRTMFRDLYSGDELSKYTSYLIIFVMFIIPSAPLLGGYLNEFFGWYSNFIFMFVYASLCLIASTFYLEETNKEFHISKLKLSTIISNYSQMLRSRVFMGITLSVFLSYGSMFGWFVVAPVLLIDKIGLTPSEFGWVNFIGAGISFCTGGILNGRFVPIFGMKKMMRIGFSIMIFSALTMSICFHLYGVNFYAMVLPYILFYFGSTFVWPNAFSTAFTPFGKIAGYAGALYGSMQISGGAILGSIFAYLPDNTQQPLAYIMLGSTVLSLLSMEWSTYSKK